MIPNFSKLLIQFLPINNGVELGFVGRQHTCGENLAISVLMAVVDFIHQG